MAINCSQDIMLRQEMKLFVAYTHNKDTKMAEEEGNINLNCQEPVTLVLGSAISERSF